MAGPEQLSLGVGLDDDATFDNFYAEPDSVEARVVASLQAQLSGAGEPVVYLWGPLGAGLTHLLQASCHAAQEAGKRFQYLPLSELADVPPEALLDGLETRELLCVDDLDAVAGRPDWEAALFHLYNRLRERNGCLTLASTLGPRQLPLVLPDLRSRLQWGVTWHLTGLDDPQKQRALQHRARARGLELSDEVAHYILQRVPRDTALLFQYLQQLDQASLAQQRKLTIPFVKKVLSLP